MEGQEFYEYIIKKVAPDGTARILIMNIIQYVHDKDFTDAHDAHTYLESLLGGVIGIDEQDIKLYLAPQCESCGKYVIDADRDAELVLCDECR